MLRKSRNLTPGAHSVGSSPYQTNTHGTGSQPVSPAMRRRRKEPGTVLKLERVLGLTSNKPSVLSVNSVHGLAAYAAGCVVVLYNYRLDKQVGLLCSATLKRDASGHLTDPSSGSLASSLSGTFGSTGTISAQSMGSGVGTGSGGGGQRGAANIQWLNNGLPNVNPLAGLMPMNLGDPSATSSFGSSNPNSNKNIKPKSISCLAFSPDGQLLAIGEMGHQPRILIWDVSSQALVGELQGHKFGVQAVQFSPNSKHIVSLGFQHDGYLHVWNWKNNLQIASNKVTTKVPNVRVLDGRSGILGELRDSSYVDAACSQDGRFTYAVTSQGVLCLFTEVRVMEKWIDLHVRGAYSLSLTESSIVCACTDGIIRLFEPETLEYIGTLPKLSPVGSFSGSMASEDVGEIDDKAVYADVLATQYDASSCYLTCIYSDRSLIIWDMSDHSNMFPDSDAEEGSSLFPKDTFITYSADGSIKFWNLDEKVSLLSPLPDRDSLPSENEQVPLSKELLRVIYVDEASKTWIQKPDVQGFNVVPTECGIRTIKISSDGRYLASGDKGGNLRVHDMTSFAQVTYQEAHDTEIMAIDFTDPQEKEEPFLVATAGRDRLLHVFNVHDNYALLQTLDDHSSSITAIRFTKDGSRMMSCGADKSIIFRNRHKSADGIQYQPYHQAPGRATVYDLEHHGQSQTVTAVSGDRRFTVFTLDTGKPIKSFKAETKGDDLAAGMAEVCSMTHISLDPTGTIAAASGSDKSVRLYDLIQGTCLAHMICHSELVTGVKFTNQYDRIISTSADGCVMVWRLAPELVRKIQVRIQENVTLPSRLLAKTSDSVAVSAPGSAVSSPLTRPVQLKRSTDRLGAFLSEQSGPSRRNSTTSLASEDFEPRSEDNSDDWSDRMSSKVESKMEDLSRLDFTPVVSTTAAKVQAQSPASVSASVASSSRPRAQSAYTKSPLNRSRQNSYSQPSTPARTSTSNSSRLGPPNDPPPWNRNIVKEKVLHGVSTGRRSLRPPSPRQVVPKTVIKGPSSARPRASSLTVTTDHTQGLGDIKSTITPKDATVAATEQDQGQVQSPDKIQSKDQSQIRKLSKAAKRMSTVSVTDKDEDDYDDELSDETESGFEDGLGMPAPPTRVLERQGLQKTKTGSTLAREGMNDVTSGKMAQRVSADGSHNETMTPLAFTQPKESLQAGSVTDEDTVAGEESEEPDGDDENMDVEDDNDSLSDTGIGSDVDRLISPLYSPARGTEGGFERSDGSSIGKSTSFHEGELMLRSPNSGNSPGKRSGTSTRVTSLRAANGAEVRRSLSAKFLMVHAASIMQSLIVPQEGQDQAKDGDQDQKKEEKDEGDRVDDGEKVEKEKSEVNLVRDSSIIIKEQERNPEDHVVAALSVPHDAKKVLLPDEKKDNAKDTMKEQVSLATHKEPKGRVEVVPTTSPIVTSATPPVRAGSSSSRSSSSSSSSIGSGSGSSKYSFKDVGNTPAPTTLPLEEQLNPLLLNKAVMRRKQLTPLGSSPALVQLRRSTTAESESSLLGASPQKDKAEIVSEENTQSSVEGRLKAFASSLYPEHSRSTTLATDDSTLSVGGGEDASLTKMTLSIVKGQESSLQVRPDMTSRGVLASPVAVKSPVNVLRPPCLGNVDLIRDGLNGATAAAAVDVPAVSDVTPRAGDDDDDEEEGAGAGVRATNSHNGGPVGTSRTQAGGYVRKVASKRLSVASKTDNGSMIVPTIATTTMTTSPRSSESLQEAFDRISFLIAHKGKSGAMSMEEGKD
ncbi:hypothetical protein BGZ94_002436, partial [Podila epigama]